MGTCTSALGDWTGPRVFDEVNSVTVNVGAGVLSSSSRTAILNDQGVNAFALGVNGRWEIAQFRDAVLLSAGVYRLSGFLRGARGTEWAMTGHLVSDQFVALTTDLRRVPLTTAQLGASGAYKAVTIGKNVAATTAQSLTDTGVGLKPFSPFDLRVSRSADAMTLSWQRRSRLKTRVTGPLGISIPLGEATEHYEVDVFDASNARVSTVGTDKASISLGGWSAGAESLPLHYVVQVGDDIIGVRSFSTVTSAAIQRVSATTGEFLGSVGLAGGSYPLTVTGLVAVGTDVYVSFVNGSNSSRVYKIPVAQLVVGGVVAPTAIYTAPVAADSQGLCFDGTALWVSCAYTGAVKKLNPADLSVIATYGAPAGVAALCYGTVSGHVFAGVRSASSAVVEIDSSGAVVQSIPCPYFPTDLLVSGGSLFVSGVDTTQVVDISTRSPLANVAIAADLFRNTFASAGSGLVATVNPATTKALLLDEQGGTQATISGVTRLGGAVIGGLYLDQGTTATDSRGYVYRRGGFPQGYSATVYQISATVGRGYPASIRL